jgi:flagellar biosynthesis/type III secretory pathway chaperone
MESSLQQHIAQLLQRETETVDTLAALLQKESDLLKAQEAEGLPDILVRKERALEILNQTQQIREQIMREQQQTDWKALLHLLDGPDGALTQQQHALEQQLKACQYYNHINAQLINRGLYGVHHLLNVIRGNSGQEKTYNQLGETESRLGTQSLIQV